VFFAVSAGIVLQQMIMIVLLMLTGYVAYKKKILNDSASTALSSLVVNVCNPALLIGSSFDRDPSVTNESLLLALAAGAVMYFVLILVSFVIPRILRVEKKEKNIYAMMCIFGNTGFIGIPLITALLGSGALIYVVIVMGYFTLVFYTYGYYLSGGEDSRFSLKNLLNIGNLSLVAAIIIFLWQPKIPALIESTVNYMSDATIFLAMVVIGINLAHADLRSIFTQPKLYGLIALRFVLVPILFSMLLRLFVKDGMVYGVMVILSAVPVGNLPLMRLEEIGEDGTVLSQGIILSTILAVVTIPVVTLFM
jgi:hypothetical protein